MGYILIDALWAGILAILDYLSHHVLACLIPAFFIAGAIGAFVKKDAILKYFGPGAKKYISYPLAAISGTVLAVCSCTILPLFAGIYRKGSGIGPATAFLYAGPAINVLAIVYTARLLGVELGLARAVGAISMSVIIGLAMAVLFKSHDDNLKKAGEQAISPGLVGGGKTLERPDWILLLLFTLMVAILLIGTSSIVLYIRLTMIFLLVAAVIVLLKRYFEKDEISDWGYETWDLTKKVFPLLIAGTFVVGFISVFLHPDIFRPYLGVNSLGGTFLGAVIGAILYMPTLLEVPIIGTTFGYTSGNMGEGPALALLLAGPAVSLPNMIVLNRIMGPKKTMAYITMVILCSTVAGFIYGNFIV